MSNVQTSSKISGPFQINVRWYNDFVAYLYLLQFIKAHPPISEESGNLTNLSVNVTVMTIDGLDEIAMTFKLKFNLQVRFNWLSLGQLKLAGESSNPLVNNYVASWNNVRIGAASSNQQQTNHLLEYSTTNFKVDSSKEICTLLENCTFGSIVWQWLAIYSPLEIYAAFQIHHNSEESLICLNERKALTPNAFKGTS